MKSDSFYIVAVVAACITTIVITLIACITAYNVVNSQAYYEKGYRQCPFGGGYYCLPDGQ